MKKRTSRVSRRVVSLLMSMVLTLTLVTPAAFAEGMGVYANGEDTEILTGTNSGDSYEVQEDTLLGISLYAAADPWDGASTVAVEPNAEGIYEISTGAQLAWLAQQVVEEFCEFEDTQFRLIEDVDLGDKSWTPIGGDDAPFNGVFDGNGHTIRGLNVPDAASPGLFGNLGKNGTIRNLIVRGVVTGGTQAGYGAMATGGICSVSEGKIQNCGFYGEVTTTDEDAGLLGVGAIVGYGDGSADNSWYYCTGTSNEVGVVGEDSTASNCYTNVNTEQAGVTVVTAEQFKGTATVGDTGKTVTELLNDTLPDDDCMNWLQGVDYPLFIKPVIKWDGTTTTEVEPNADGVYEISTGAQLAWLAQQVVEEFCEFEDTQFRLIEDVDLGDKSWTPIGGDDAPFNGVFDGNGHTIRGLNVPDAASPGLFGNLGKNGTIRNLIVRGVVTGGTQAGYGAMATGGICSVSEGKIQNCGFYGEVTTTDEDAGLLGVGAIVGYGDGSADNSWYYCTGTSNEVGVVGEDSTASNCYTNVNTEQAGVTVVTAEQFKGTATVGDTGKTVTELLNDTLPDDDCMNWTQGADYPVFATGGTEQKDKTVKLIPLFPDCKFIVSVNGEGVAYDTEAKIYTVSADTAAIKLIRSDGEDELWVSKDESGKGGAKVTDGEYTLSKAKTTLYYGTEADFAADIAWWYGNQTGKRYAINSTAALRGIARLVNSGMVEDGFDGDLLELRGVPNATLDLSDIAYEPIGTADHPFRGSFAGQYYGGTAIGRIPTFITGLTISGNYVNTGLFGVVNGGTVQYVTIADTTKTVENAEKTVSAGIVTGSGNVGSIVGWLQSGTVENCMSTAVVNGSGNAAVVGGLVGLNEGAVSSSYYYNDEHIGTLVVGKTDGENASAKQSFYLVGKGESTFGEESDTGAREKLEFEAGRVTYELNGSNGYLWLLDTVAKRPTLKDAYPRTMNISQLTLTAEELPEGAMAEIRLGDENTIVFTSGNTQYVYGKDFLRVPVTVESVTAGYQIVFSPALRDGKLQMGSDYTYKLTAADISWYVGHESDMEYTLTTASQLEGFAILVNGTAEGDVSFKGKTIKLGNDIELTGTWTPIGIGANGHFFEGTFDGQKHTIKGLRVNTNDTYAGLFGYVRYGAIKDLTVEGSVRSSGANTAGIVGYLYQGTVENCTNKAEVTAVRGNVGGVVGHAYEGNGECRIENCKNNAVVTVTGNEVSGTTAGGIVGSTGDKVIVRLCENTGNVTASGTKNVSASGIGGRRVLNSHNSGRVEIASGTADYLYAGGITAQGLVDSCQNDGEVYINAMWNGGPGFNYAGGITGGGTVTNSYNTAAVVNNFTYADGAAKSQNGIVAGIAANPTSSIFNCYNTGDVSSADGVAYGLGGVGVPGVCDSGVENSYYVCKVSGEELMKYVSTAGVESVVDYNEADKTYMVGDKLLVDLLNENGSGGTPWFVNAEKGIVLPTFVVLWNGDQHAACTGIKLVYVIYEPGDGICRTATGQPRKDAIVLKPDETGMIQQQSYIILDAEAAGVANENGTFQMWSDGSNPYAAGGTITLSGDEGSITLTAQWETIWSGTGTEADPYKISNAEELAALIPQVNDNGFDYKGKHFALAGDIDLTGMSWMPIGIAENAFAGNLDGNHCTIRGLNVNAASGYAGMFGSVSYGTFQDLTLESPVITGNDYCGSLIGYGGGTTLINITAKNVAVSSSGRPAGGLAGRGVSKAESCAVEGGNVTGYDRAAGIGTAISDNAPTIVDCHNSATIEATAADYGLRKSIAAGIWACDTFGAHGTFMGCTNSGTVSGQSYAAGIATAGHITGCANSGATTSTNGLAAGISNNGNAEKCSNTGNITGYGSLSATAHGVAGITNYENGASFCYNTGNIICTYNKNWAYGIAAGGAISNCFSYVAGKDIALAPNTLAEGKVINSYYLASKKDAVSSAGEYATLADFASGKVAWGVDGGTGAHKNYWTQDTQRGNNQLPAGPGRAYPKPIEDPNTEFSVYRALVQYGTGGTATLAANGYGSENQENAVYGMKGTSVTVTATPKDNTFGLKSLTLDLMGTGSTTALESGGSFTLGEANALVVAAFASTGNGGSGDGTGGTGGNGDGTGTDTGDGAGDENDEGLQDGLNLEVEYDVKGLVLAAYGAWGAEGSGKTFTQWLKDSPEVLRALITNSLDNMAVAAMGKKTDEAKDLAALLLASLNEHSGLDGQSSDTIAKMLRRYIESGTEAAFSAWLTTGGGMASGTYESIFAQYTNSLLALADRLYTNWESSGTSLTFPQWLDAQQVTMESLSENAEEPDTDTDDTQTSEAPEDVPDGQEAEGGASSGGNSVWEVIGTVVRENPIIVWSIVAVVAALVIVGAVRRYHKVKRDEHDDVASKK